MRFAKSLYPDVKAQNLLDISRQPSRLITFRSEEETWSFWRKRFGCQLLLSSRGDCLVAG